MLIDLRSDTVTKPSPAMLDFMQQAPVGDDVFGEDPTINALEQKVAELFGMDNALFCPTGTMANQLAIKCHTQPGDEVICEFSSHVYQYEAGGIAFHSGCQAKALVGDRGRLTADQIRQAINPVDIHKAPTRLVCLENTANRGGGSCYALTELEKIKAVCTEHQLPFHLDGARLWNAMVARQETPTQYGSLFDSISVCLSKGLGAPVGSVLVGSASFINKARRYRKLFGGGMRQAGILAAAGIFAIDHHIDDLERDHVHTSQIADLLLNKPWVASIFPAETNILIATITQPYTATTLVERLKQQGILCFAISPTDIRMVFHRDIDNSMINQLADVLNRS